MSAHESAGYIDHKPTSCPRLLVSRTHDGMSCWCSSPLRDHAATYSRGGSKVVLWEPYQAPADELMAVLEAAKRDGLQVTVHGNSPHAPGSTFVLEFKADPERSRRH